jgi:homopolymeric O-antigen transport system permease protein
MSTISGTTLEMQGEREKLLPLIRATWRSRGLVRTLARKDFYVRYRRASIGLLWVIGLPITQAIVLAIIFSRVVRFETPVKFPVFVLSGTLPWNFFSGAFGAATTSIVDGSGLATKVYFPRAVLPLVTVVSAFHGYIPALGVMIALALVLGVHLGVALVLLIPAMMLMLLLTSVFALLFASLYVYFRDMRYVVAASLFPWFWASGVIFPLDKLKGARQWFELNPAVGIIQLNRAGIGAAASGWQRPVIITCIWVVVMALACLPLYQRYDRVYVDLL